MGIPFVLRDFLSFLKNPHTEPLHAAPTTLLSGVRWAIVLFFSLFVIRFAGIALEAVGFRPLILFLTGHELARQQVESSTLGLLLGALVMAPLLEETAYRW